MMYCPPAKPRKDGLVTCLRMRSSKLNPPGGKMHAAVVVRVDGLKTLAVLPSAQNAYPNKYQALRIADGKLGSFRPRI